VTAVQLRSTLLFRGVAVRVGGGGLVWSSTIVSVMTAALRLPLQSVNRAHICFGTSPAGTGQPLYAAS
jgi:hypothetical protein